MRPLAEILPACLSWLATRWVIRTRTTPTWGIAQRIQQMSQEFLQVGQGSLYTALQRLEARRWITSDWGPSENKRRAKFYSLTRQGRKQLEAEMTNWKRIASAIALVLEEG